MCLCNSKHLVTSGKDYINNTGWGRRAVPGRAAAHVETEEGISGATLQPGGEGTGLEQARVSAVKWEEG